MSIKLKINAIRKKAVMNFLFCIILDKNYDVKFTYPFLL